MGAIGGSDVGGAGGAGTDGGPPLPLELAWTRQGPLRLIEDIWGSGGDDIYGAGRNGDLVRSTGNGTWTLQPTDTGANITGIWGSGPSDVYASVNANVILHSMGDGEWDHQSYDAGFTFNGIWGLDAQNVYLVGPGVVHRGPQGWGDPQSVSNAAPTFAIWGSSPDDLYVTTGAAAGSVIYHSTGDGTWLPQAGAPAATAADAIWGLDANHIWVGADYTISFSTGDGDWSTQLTVPSPRRVTAIWGTGPDALYACTQGGFFYRSNGHGTWSEGQEIAPGASISCFAIWGTGPDNIYLGTAGGIYHGVPVE